MQCKSSMCECSFEKKYIFWLHFSRIRRCCQNACFCFEGCRLLLSALFCRFGERSVYAGVWRMLNSDKQSGLAGHSTPIHPTVSMKHPSTLNNQTKSQWKCRDLRIVCDGLLSARWHCILYNVLIPVPLRTTLQPLPCFTVRPLSGDEMWKWGMIVGDGVKQAEVKDSGEWKIKEVQDRKTEWKIKWHRSQPTSQTMPIIFYRKHPSVH